MATLFYTIDALDSSSRLRVRIAPGKAKKLEPCLIEEKWQVDYRKTHYDVADIQDIGYELAKNHRFGRLSITIAERLTELTPLPVWVEWLSFGLSLAGYRYRYRERAEPAPTMNTVHLDCDEEALIAVHEQGGLSARSQIYARELMNKPGNVLYPETFVQAVRAIPLPGVVFKVLGESQMGELGFGGLLGISRGSEREGKLLILEYTPEAATTTIALVGKGVTFDSGGISIKPAKSMSTMKFDMGGAAAVIGALYAVAQSCLPVRVIGLCGLVENMPSGRAARPGDVVTMLSGQSVEIISTDAEGRMVLADVLHYAQKTYRPDYLIDIATLTGGAGVALGKGFSALMGTSEALEKCAIRAGVSCAEPVWPMPIGGWFSTALESDYADLKNGSEDPHGSASVAASFLGHFIAEGQKWCHIDSAAMAHDMPHRRIYDKAATGYGALLLSRICRVLAAGA